MTSTSATAIPPLPQAAQSVNVTATSIPSQSPTPSANPPSTTSGIAAVSQPTGHRLSYSQAAGKKAAAPATIVSSTPAPPTQSPVASSPVVGGNPGQNARPTTNASPVNGKTSSITPAVPAVVPPPTIVNSGGPIVNGSSGTGGFHSRKSSLASGAPGQSWPQQNGLRMPPGQQPSGPNSIQFGSINQNSATNTPSGGPMATPVLPNAVTPNLTPATMNNQINSPQVSAAQPAASGGPPQLPRSNMPTFGSMNDQTSDQNSNRNMPPQRPTSIPPTAPMNNNGPGQASHMRRDSSHGGENFPSGMGRGMPQNGPRRGNHMGGGYNQHQGHNQYNNNAYGSQQPYRNNAGAGRGLGDSVYANPHSHMGGYQPNRGASNGGRSPALTHSLPSTPQMPAAQIAGNPPMQSPSFAYANHLAPHIQNMPQIPGMYGGYDQGYYNPQAYMGYNTGHYMQPSSPRTGYTMPQHQQAQGYSQQYPSQPSSMARSTSQMSEQHVPRPPSGMAHLSQTPTLSAASIAPQQPLAHPGPTLESPFKRVEKASKKIEIRDPNTRAVRSFDKPVVSPTPRTTNSPIIVSSSPAPDNGHERSNSTSSFKPSPARNVSTKTDQEKRNEALAAVQKKIQEDLIAEKKKKEEEDAKKAEKERLEKEEEEARLKAEEEEARLAKEKEEEEARKVEEEAKAKAEAEEKARLEEEEKQKKAEEERLQKEKEEAERVAREKAEEEAKEKAEAEAAEKERLAEEAKSKEAEKAKEEEKTVEKADGDDDEPASKVVDEAAKDVEEAVAKSKPIAPDAKAVEDLASDIAKISVSGNSADDALGSVPRPSRKPAPLNLQLKTSTEPALPSAALTALRSARFIDDINSIAYPSSILSPNPALNASAPTGKFKYEKDFLMQFQTVFVEKPSVDWDSRMRDTMGETDSARPISARTPSMSAKSTSRPGGSMAPPSQGGAMGSFGKMGGLGLLAQQGRQPSNSFMGAGGALGGMSNFRPAPGAIMRTGSSTNISAQVNAPPQSPSSRNRSVRGQSKRGQGNGPMDSRQDSKKGGKEPENHSNGPMLVAASDVKPLEVSKTRWQPRSVQAATTPAAAAAAGPAVTEDGRLPPDMVQRKVKAALNKMTPEKFDKIADQILEIASQSRTESDGRSLRQVIQLTFEKATDEPNFSSMYAKFCKRMLDDMDPEIKDENIKDKHGSVVTGGALFRKYLLNRCQEEFERGWKVNLPPKPEGVADEAVMLSDEYYVAMAAKRRGLGLIQFIGELFKLGMLTERIMHECMKKLVDYEGMPEEEEVESLCKLLRTIGKALDSTEKSKPMMDVYFERIKRTMDMKDLPSRMGFLLFEIVELRKSGWASKEDEKGPKTIQEIHEEAAKASAEKEAANANARVNAQRRPPPGRGDSRQFSQLGGQGFQDQRQNQAVDSGDLRRLGAKRTQTTVGATSFGPSSMFASARSSSSGSKKGLGPPGSFGGLDSGASSRTATPPTTANREPVASLNSFSLLSQHTDQSEAAEVPDATSPPEAKTRVAELKTSAEQEGA